MQAHLRLLDKAVAGPELVSLVTEKNRAVLALVGLSEWQAGGQAVESEARRGKRMGSHPQIRDSQQALANSCRFITKTSEAGPVLDSGRQVCSEVLASVKTQVSVASATGMLNVSFYFGQFIAETIRSFFGKHNTVWGQDCFPLQMLKVKGHLAGSVGTSCSS